MAEQQDSYEDLTQCGLDEDNEAELHDERIKNWLVKVITECNLLPS